jgi:NAD(P)-dependent dehydrogenase (short-subunit alcohol dehydrogenase family)
MGVPAFKELLDLTGKVAIVTGASQGIGAGIAARFAEAGANVLVHYRSDAAGAERVVRSIREAGGDAHPAQAELAVKSGVDKLIAFAVRELGGLNVMVNGAGIFPAAPFLEVSPEDWRAMYSANVDTAFLCTQAAAAHMKSAGGGAIVNIASIAATSPGPDHSHYNSAKAAVVMLTRSAAQELGRFGIRVNAVSPGVIGREGIEEQWPEGVARWRARAPLKRLGRPDDVADACLFLASAASRWITGHDLIVDGGVMAASIY